jgi:hypothetical protein
MLLSSLVYITANAQVRACIFCASNINDQPSWGPAGYDFVYYYYLPEIEVYYYVPGHQFTYQKDGNWVTSNTLPLRYAAFNFYKAYKVVMNADGIEPYFEHNVNKVEYAAYKNKHDQPVNRDSEQYKSAREKERIDGLAAGTGGL